MTLLDDVKDLPPRVWSNTGMLPHVTKHVQALAPRARQFVFDEGASRLVGAFIRDCPDVLADQLQFARQPYDITYIEIDIQALYDTLGKRTLYYGERDWKVGFLSHGGTIYVLTNSRERPEAALAPTCTFDYEYRPVASDPLSDDSKVLLGSTWNLLSDDQRNAFAQRFNVGYLAHERAREKAIEIMLPAIAGEARVYVACLLFLFQKQHITVTDHPFERRLSRGKLRTYMARSTVTIHLATPIEMRRAFSTADRASPRRHEVRTHYKHRHLTPGCEHQWQRVEDAENEQWRCTSCSGLRYLCRDHLRGDGGSGFVTKNYNVTL